MLASKFARKTYKIYAYQMCINFNTHRTVLIGHQIKFDPISIEPPSLLASGKVTRASRKQTNRLSYYEFMCTKGKTYEATLSCYNGHSSHLFHLVKNPISTSNGIYKWKKKSQVATSRDVSVFDSTNPDFIFNLHSTYISEKFVEILTSNLKIYQVLIHISLRIRLSYRL